MLVSNKTTDILISRTTLELLELTVLSPEGNFVCKTSNTDREKQKKDKILAQCIYDHTQTYIFSTLFISRILFQNHIHVK